MKTTLLIFMLTFLYTYSTAQPGTLDKTYGEEGKVYAKGEKLDAYAVAIQSDGKIIEGGFGSIDSGAVSGFYLTRFNTDGTIDKRFGKAGKVVSHLSDNGAMLKAIAVQSNGRIVVAGDIIGTGFGSANMLVRYLPDGSLDSSFGEGDSGIVIAPVQTFDNPTAIVIQPDDKIILTGTTRKGINGDEKAFVYRFTKNGKPDKTFGLKGRVITSFDDYTEINAIALQPDGKVVIAGDFYITSTKALVIRYQPDGHLDSSFGVAGVATMGFGTGYIDGVINSIAVQTDGKLVCGGYAQRNSEYEKMTLVRFTDKGLPDLTFGNSGTILTSFGLYGSEVKKILLQSDGRIVAVGQYSGFTFPDDDSFFSYYALARYLIGGKIDSTFGTNGLQTTDMGPSAFCIGGVIQADGKVVAAGAIYGVKKKNPLYSSKFALARYLTTKTFKAPLSTAVENQVVKSSSLNIYPNPVGNILHIEGLSVTDRTTLLIKDVKGVIVMQTQTTGCCYNWEIGKLTPAVYFLQVRNTNGNITKVIIKQ